MLQEGSLLPLFLPFLPEERQRRLTAAAKGGGGKAIPFLTGVMGSRLSQPKMLRVCPQCAEEDKARYGEAHWHRSHQVEGMNACHRHGCRLVDSGVERGPRKNRHAFHPVPEVEWPRGAIANTKATRLAQEIHWLLNVNRCRPGSKRLLEAYKAALIEHRLAHPSGRLHLQQLVELFHAHHGSLLKETGCQITDVEKNWLADMLRNRRRCPHPVQHLLVIHFLGFGVEEFFSRAINPHPPQISVPPKPFRSERTKVDHKTLRRLWGKYTVSLRKISRTLGVDPMTTKRYAAALGLPFPRPAVRPTRSKPRVGQRRKVQTSSARRGLRNLRHEGIPRAAGRRDPLQHHRQDSKHNGVEQGTHEKGIPVPCPPSPELQKP